MLLRFEFSFVGGGGVIEGVLAFWDGGHIWERAVDFMGVAFSLCGMGVLSLPFFRDFYSA